MRLRKVLELFDYKLPKALIAEKPASPRDSAKLLVFNRTDDTVRYANFRNLADFLPENSVLVVNTTKVIPAHLKLTKKTGGVVSALFLRKAKTGIEVIANKKLVIGETLTISHMHRFTVTKSLGKSWMLRPNFPMSKLAVILERYGRTPLPPYLKHSPLSEAQRKREYQTVFAKKEGSIAAPTASLHFTPRLLDSLKTHGVRVVSVTLHVHLGTFAPLSERHWQKKQLHTEQYEIDLKTARALEKAKNEGHSIIAVGTTVVRALESASDEWGKISKRKGSTKIFITEKTPLHFVDGLITNFHVPRSSLLMLVSSLTGRKKLMDLYRLAIAKEFRFFSFGDGMLILPKKKRKSRP